MVSKVPREKYGATEKVRENGEKEKKERIDSKNMKERNKLIRKKNPTNVHDDDDADDDDDDDTYS